MKFRKTFRNLNAVQFFVWKLVSSGIRETSIRVKLIDNGYGNQTSFRVTWTD